MSKYRHFRDSAGGVISLAHPVSVREAASDPEYKEVQVVPLDAVVMGRSTLPEVRYDVVTDRAWATDGSHDRYLSDDDTPGSLRDRAAMYLALAEYREANPPMDEGQVDMLARMIRDADEEYTTWLAAARSLVKAGVRVEVRES